MKKGRFKLTQFLFTCLAFFAIFNLAQAGTQPLVTVRSYAQHLGNNIVYNYLVTNHGASPLFRINIGCNCPSDFTLNSPDPVPQLLIYPVNYDFGRRAGVSAGSYSAPAGWEGYDVDYDEVGYFSFEFSPPMESGISLLPGQTGTFSITTPKEEKRGYFRSFYASRPEGITHYYDMNRRGYLTGYYSYYEEDTDGKGKMFSYPMQLIDQTPPNLTVILTPNILKSSHEKSVPITATIAVKDDYDPQPEIKLESIIANEVLEKEDIKGAMIGIDDRQFMLKAERKGKNKAGRIYTVTYSAIDASGNKSSASATVTVPHDEREHEGSGEEKSRKSAKD